MSSIEPQTPPAGEEIHLPGPSLIPLICAIGITLAIVGTTLGLFVSIIGLVIFLVTCLMWIRDTRRDIDQLPDEHL